MPVNALLTGNNKIYYLCHFPGGGDDPGSYDSPAPDGKSLLLKQIDH